MEIRPAIIHDAKAICELVNQHAEKGLMLHRSLESVYDALREFIVAVDDSGSLTGCVAVDIFWADLAEVKSLAVLPGARGGGLGLRLVTAAIEDARRLGVRRLFALTYEKGFFSRLGFKIIDRMELPEKVWRECIACPKVDACDETAMILHMEESFPCMRGEELEGNQGGYVPQRKWRFPPFLCVRHLSPS